MGVEKAAQLWSTASSSLTTHGASMFVELWRRVRECAVCSSLTRRWTTDCLRTKKRCFELPVEEGCSTIATRSPGRIGPRENHRGTAFALLAHVQLAPLLSPSTGTLDPCSWSLVQHPFRNPSPSEFSQRGPITAVYCGLHTRAGNPSIFEDSAS